MKTYLVSWFIHVEAESPLDAAKLAQEIQRDPDSTATVFKVEEQNGQMFDLSLEANKDG